MYSLGDQSAQLEKSITYSLEDQSLPLAKANIADRIQMFVASLSLILFVAEEKEKSPTKKNWL